MLENCKFSPTSITSAETFQHDWAARRQALIAGAHQARSDLLRDVLTQLTRAITGNALALAHVGLASVARRRAEWVAKRQDQVAIARLKSLDDSALKDIGIQRTEIESIVHARDADDTRKRGIERLAA